jgi:hypothetical protein
MERDMKYVTAIIGAILVFFGATIGMLFLPSLLIPKLFQTVPGLIAAYCVAIPLALVAAYFSFRATLKVYAKDKGSPSKSSHS